jgi:hypothetical protein
VQQRHLTAFQQPQQRLALALQLKRPLAEGAEGDAVGDVYRGGVAGPGSHRDGASAVHPIQAGDGGGMDRLSRRGAPGQRRDADGGDAGEGRRCTLAPDCSLHGANMRNGLKTTRSSQAALSGAVHPAASCGAAAGTPAQPTPCCFRAPRGLQSVSVSVFCHRHHQHPTVVSRDVQRVATEQQIGDRQPVRLREVHRAARRQRVQAAPGADEPGGEGADPLAGQLHIEHTTVSPYPGQARVGGRQHRAVGFAQQVVYRHRR